ncbi:MAG TPA: hypothetical protein EYP58_00080 [bacterium (Candidatus Stahlbacteria)]|nr:hypothetical protein [Candidatus Stahlbacteria bacterium]
MKGFTAIGIIIALVIIAILSLIFIRRSGVSSPETTEAPIERAKTLDCRMKLKIIEDEIRIYQAEHGSSPKTLDEVRADFTCPVSGTEYEYDEETGRVWCPEHSQR